MPGYEHSGNLFQGEIRNVDGVRIVYDLDPNAGDKAAGLVQGKHVRWSKRQRVNSGSFHIVMIADTTFVVTFTGMVSGNFEAENVRTTADLTDVLLMLATFDPMKGLPR